MLKVILPDGSEKVFEQRVRAIEIATSISAGLARTALAGTVQLEGELDEAGKPVVRTIGMDTFLPESGTVHFRLLTKKDPEALAIMRHSAAHVMARAVMRLFKDVQLAFGPTVENGFYYDFWKEEPFTESDFAKIEAEMKKIV